MDATRRVGLWRLDYDEAGNVVVVSFPYDQALNAALRSAIPGMRWDPERRRWILPARQAAQAARVLGPRGFIFGDSFTQRFLDGAADALGADLAAGTAQSLGAKVEKLPPGALSVGELIARIKQALERAFPTACWVAGTLQGFDKVARYAGKSYAFKLADWDADARQAICQIDALLWPNVLAEIQARFAAAGVELRDTLPVLLRVRVGLWDVAAKLQIYVEDADPAYTVGKILEGLDALHARLVAEGLGERNLRLPWPYLPLRIGLVTSPKDAYGDFIRILGQSGFPFTVHFAESRVQGPETARSVSAALRSLESEGVDCIAIVRGGGANADLSWFNDYSLGKAICLCSVPVIAGIGHDRDETLPDRLARSRSNPTAVAESLVRQVEEAMAQRTLRAARTFQAARLDLGSAAARIGDRERRVALGAARHLTGHQRLILAAGLRLGHAVSRGVERERFRLEGRGRDVAARDPALLLARGYARVVTARGRSVRRVADLAPGQQVRLRLVDGTADATITSVTPRASE